ncbi:molecular chaperone GrpE [Bathymodiolus platifrons methanotrophic gill symbiont]|uniref:nucleotide exchange factor GrpE n=1 Tax=Bathymodiolus platifrons methanotrophic gill symbiont TaxID=113268 RepID=UPI000B41198D|nr:nucleotide exchange factor GrpE [Bathymodiolus platifrons methanotrophic gill symbiont]MCK5870091.1 nucleotide exchange factor GrpE [Methyloprofundus sp.]TXK96466.1 nucleotide exchange factor GrpE [Methylococcaceae bacterium CS4]TXK98867.1 nucleotide exchange factor GrpE [Methylococcaceae bacterium CS5]TXL05320.1 nucleotide exchange factor GrpE [Methylococcaceae bacterium CS3]TXL06773.1 nucleotide exchange factor GrpE [Methylococcaceae bacterium CS1]TXL09689.1 nucleotide exchange factor Gr
MSKDQPSPESQSESDVVEGVLEQDAELDIDEATTEEVEVLEVEDTELSIEELQKKLVKAESKAADNWDKVLRIQAEMDNLKRRTQKDLDSAHKYGLEKFAKELLSVIDSLELGIQAATSDVPEVVKLKEGSELTVKQFETVFAKFNIEAIDPIEQPFNPEFHQAMTMVPTADAEPNTVINVFQKGYVLNGRLIRPAMVVVAQAAA